MEIFRVRQTIATGLAISLGITACGGESSVARKVTTESEVGNKNDVGVSYDYTPTGKRITTYDETDDLRFDQILSYCDGRDLMDINPIQGYDNGSPTRTPQHTACVDGVLTPSDFELSE